MQNGKCKLDSSSIGRSLSFRCEMDKVIYKERLRKKEVKDEKKKKIFMKKNKNERLKWKIIEELFKNESNYKQRKSKGSWS